ncbi:MAG: M48 family metalloprotease [Bdellovibrionales bacterium]|jgi:Zn-dependent protease with chaperone function
MSYFKPVIASELNTYKSTRREKIGILASFALAATAVCVGAATASTPLVSLLPAMAHKAVTIAGLMAGVSIITRFLLTKKEVSSWNRDKYEDLQQTAKEYSNKMGLHETPQIRIWRKNVPVGPAAAPFFHKFDVIFNEDSFDRYNQAQLRGILGHEMAHVKKNHMWKTQSLNILAMCASVMAPAFGILAPLLIFSSARRNEFQADRIGAVVSQNPLSLASALRTHENNSSREKLHDWHYSSVPQKLGKCALAPVRTILKGWGYWFLTVHPATERRIERLETMDNPPSKYRSDSVKARLVRLAL